MSLLITLHGNAKDGDLYYRYALVPFLPRCGDIVTVIEHVGMRVDEIRFQIHDDACADVYVHVRNEFAGSDFEAFGFTRVPGGNRPPPAPTLPL